MMSQDHTHLPQVTLFSTSGFQMHRWLGYANQAASFPDANGKRAPAEEQTDLFLRREFSFTIEDDVYIR